MFVRLLDTLFSHVCINGLSACVGDHVCIDTFAYVEKAEADFYATSFFREPPVSDPHVLRAHELDHLAHHIFM